MLLHRVRIILKNSPKRRYFLSCSTVSVQLSSSAPAPLVCSRVNDDDLSGNNERSELGKNYKNRVQKLCSQYHPTRKRLSMSFKDYIQLQLRMRTESRILIFPFYCVTISVFFAAMTPLSDGLLLPALSM